MKTHVVLPLDLGRVEVDVVGPPRGRVHQPVFIFGEGGMRADRSIKGTGTPSFPLDRPMCRQASKRSTFRRTHAPAGDALEEEVVLDDEVHHLVDLPALGLQHLVQLLRLPGWFKKQTATFWGGSVWVGVRAWSWWWLVFGGGAFVRWMNERGVGFGTGGSVCVAPSRSVKCMHACMPTHAPASRCGESRPG